MRHKYLNSLNACVITLVVSFTSAAETWTIDGKDYEMTVISRQEISEGVTHSMLKLSGETQLEIQLIEVDMTSGKADFYTNKSRNPDPELKLKVSEDRLYAKTLSEQMQEVIEAGHTPLVGINGDFFSSYGSLGNQISNGTIVRCDITSYPVWYMTSDRRFNIGKFQFRAKAHATYSACNNIIDEYSVRSINNYRDENYLTIFTPAPGRSTGTNKYGYELYAELVEGEVGFKGKCKFRIVDGPESHVRKDSSLDNYYVLSGHGDGGLFLTGKWNGSDKPLIDPRTGNPYPYLVAGDEVEVAFTTDIPDTDIKEMIGGNPVLLLDGEVQDTDNALDHLVAKEPRTCIAYTSDNTKAFLAVVDGRRPGESEGCTSRQLAWIMKNAGADNAFNLDGGGSSCMLDARTNTVMNKPTDGFGEGIYDKQRATQNSLWIIARDQDSSGIEGISAEDCQNTPVEYYNLQGVRVANPKHGFYIRRKDGITTKIKL